MNRRLVSAGLAAGVFACLLSAAPADAQWHASVLALRTSGSVVRAGDCVRLDLLSLEFVPGPITPRVTYRYTESVTVTDSEGRTTTTTRPATRDLPPGPAIDGLAPLQRAPLDDSLCFGEGTLPGVYLIEVALRQGSSASPLATLRTCVVFEPASANAAAPAGTRQATADCALLIRGVKRAESGGTIVFDGNFAQSGYYKAALVRNNRVEAVIDDGLFQSDAHEFVINAPQLQQAAGGDMDLVILDASTGTSTTLARFVVPRGN